MGLLDAVRSSPRSVVVVAAFALFIDAMLMTVILPIVPDYLQVGVPTS